MSVPRPATLVATVIVFPIPAFAMVIASSLMVLASNRLNGIVSFSSNRAIVSKRFILIHPTSVGRPVRWLSLMRLMIAFSFCSSVLYTRNGISTRISGL